MNLNQDFASYLRKLGKQPATIESYVRDSRSFISYLEDYKLTLANITPEIVHTYQDYLKSERKDRPNSVRRMLIGLRQFYRFLESQQLISNSALERSVIPKRIDELTTKFDHAQLERLFQKLNQSTKIIEVQRNQVILCFLALEGLKASEVINLKWNAVSGLNHDKRPCFLTVPGSRHRTIKLDDRTSTCLHAYQKSYETLRANNQRKLASDFILVGFMGRNSSRLLPKMTRHGLKFILNELGTKSEIKHLNSEMLRHFAIDYHLSQGEGEEEIMAHFGLRRLGNIAFHLSNLPSPKSDS